MALLDLKQLQVDSIVPTMSAAEQRKILTARFLTAMALTALPGPMVFTPKGLRNEALAARPDGRFLYALDIDSHEVTVIDVQTATVVRRIPVDQCITQLQVSSDGNRLLCIPESSSKGKAVQKIDLASNNMES